MTKLKSLNMTEWFIVGILLILTTWLMVSNITWAQRTYFPIVENIVLSNIEQQKEGMSFDVEFDKLYACDFISVNWFEGSRRIYIEYLVDEGRPTYTRPIGHNFAGKWLLHNTFSLKGTYAVVVHECTYLPRQAITKFYPTDTSDE